MGFWSDLAKWWWGESRTIDASDFNKAIFDTGDPVYAGVKVSQEQALRLIAVYRCVRLKAETVASLPVDSFRTQGTDRVPTPPPTWMEQPNKETGWFTFIERMGASWDLDGNAYILTVGADKLGLPEELWLLNPRDVEIKRDERTNEIYYLFQGTERLSRYQNLSARRGDVLHVPAFSAPGAIKGLSPIEMARQGIGLGLVTERFGSQFFGSGQHLSGVIEMPPATAHQTREQVEIIKENWVALHGGIRKAHAPGVLSGGATWKPISISPEHAQFLETRKFQVTEIARLFGVPPHLIADVEKSTSWGTGIEEQNRQWLNLTLLPQIVRLEDTFKQFLPRGQYLKWNVRGFLRGDTKTRYDAYAVLLDRQVIVPNEVRAWEDMNPVEWGDEPIQPQGAAPKAEEPDPKKPLEIVPEWSKESG